MRRLWLLALALLLAACGSTVQPGGVVTGAGAPPQGNTGLAGPQSGTVLVETGRIRSVCSRPWWIGWRRA